MIRTTIAKQFVRCSLNWRSANAQMFLAPNVLTDLAYALCVGMVMVMAVTVIRLNHRTPAIKCVLLFRFFKAIQARLRIAKVGR